MRFVLRRVPILPLGRLLVGRLPVGKLLAGRLLVGNLWARLGVCRGAGEGTICISSRDVFTLFAGGLLTGLP